MVSISGYENQIEIVISDNASTDDTVDTIRSFQIRYPWIRYSRNEVNIGGERNFYRLATLATGDYIWIFGDDDKLSEEAISIVMKLINSGKNYKLFICDYYRYSKDFKEKKVELAYGLSNVSTINNHNDLMKIFGWRLGYISSLIFNRSIFLAVSKEKYNKYLEYRFPFLYMIYHGVIDDCLALYINKPLVYNRMHNSMFCLDESWKCFVVGISIILNDLKNDGYSAQSVNITKNKIILYYVIPHVVSFKIRGDLTIRKCRELFYDYGKSLFFWFFCFPILLIPNSCLRQAKKIKHTVIKFKKNV